MAWECQSQRLRGALDGMLNLLSTHSNTNFDVAERLNLGYSTDHGQPPIMKPHRGTLILVFGILGLVACAPLGIVAWVMGNGDLKQIDAGAMDPTGRSTTNAGRICGMIATILLAVGIVLGIVLVGFGVLGGILSHR
jgi:hypothetical protein